MALAAASSTLFPFKMPDTTIKNRGVSRHKPTLLIKVPFSWLQPEIHCFKLIVGTWVGGVFDKTPAIKTKLGVGGRGGGRRAGGGGRNPLRNHH